VEFDEVTARRNIQAVRPGMEMFTLSSKSGEGMAEFLEFLASRRTQCRAAATV
jgi:hydrogenase nickel incorporation protein HypB